MSDLNQSSNAAAKKINHETLPTLLADVYSLTGTETTAAIAAQTLAAKLPTAIWRKPQVGWLCTNYADCNARGENKRLYSDDAYAIVLDGFSVNQVGGQNAGSYALGDAGLYFTSRGTCQQVASVEGRWSQWQGSSSHYDVTGWDDVAITDELLGRVVTKVIERLTELRDELRDRHAAGVGNANRLLAALAVIA